MKKRYSKELFDQIKEGILSSSDPVEHGYALIALWGNEWTTDLITKVEFFVKGIESVVSLTNEPTETLNSDLTKVFEIIKHKDHHYRSMSLIDDLDIDDKTDELLNYYDEHSSNLDALRNDLRDASLSLVFLLEALREVSDKRIIVI